MRTCIADELERGAADEIMADAKQDSPTLKRAPSISTYRPAQKSGDLTNDEVGAASSLLLNDSSASDLDP